MPVQKCDIIPFFDKNGKILRISVVALGCHARRIQARLHMIGRYLKNRILAQDSVFAQKLRRDEQVGAEFPRMAGFPVRSYPFCGSQPAGIRTYVEDLKRGSNKDIGSKDIFETASIRIKKRLGATVFFLMAALAVSSAAPPTMPAAENVEQKIDCDLHNGPCTKKLSGLTVTLEVNPRPVKAMVDLLFKVSLSGNLPPTASPPYIDLGMPGMDMGPNRVILKSAGPGIYQGPGIIVRCPSGRKIWRATVQIPTIGPAEFIFHVIY